MVSNIQAIRNAIEQAKTIAAEFQTGTISFYEEGNATPVLTTTCRLRKPKPSAFDAGNQTEWATKRNLVARIPLDLAGDFVVRKGLIAQVSTPDGDPTLNKINFVVQSSLTSQFAAEREVTLVTEVTETPRIVP